MMQYFQEGGWPMWPILFLSVLGLVASGLAVAAGRGRAGVALGVGTSVLGLMVAATGVLGWQLGRAQTDAAVMNASPDTAELMRQVGYAESSHALVCGLAGAGIPLLCGMAAVFLSLARARGDRENPGPRGG